jgi:hypothetical protein
LPDNTDLRRSTSDQQCENACYRRGLSG